MAGVAMTATATAARRSNRIGGRYTTRAAERSHLAVMRIPLRLIYADIGI
jgi:hypothetical protein